MNEEVAPSPGGSTVSEWRAWCAVIALALAASLTSIRNGFAYDDRPLILSNPGLHHLAHLGRLWAESYWPPWMGSGLYRPLTTTAFALEWALGNGAPWAFHLASILLYAGVSVLVYQLARLLLPPMAALVSAALFAVNPVHVEAVGNVVGQSELLAAAAVISAVLVYTLARRRVVARSLLSTSQRGQAEGQAFAALGGRGPAIAVVLLVALACFAKEHAVVTPALLLAAEEFLVADPRPRRERWRSLRPIGLALACAVLGYVTIRAHVLGVFTGDRPNVVLEHLSTSGRYWTMLGIVSEWVRLLWWPVHLSADYAPQQITLYDHFALGLVPDLLVLASVVALLLASWKRWPAGAFALRWLVITLVLVSNVIVPTGVLLAERTLFLPSVGAMLLVGAVAARVAPRLSLDPRSWEVAAVRVALAVLVVAAAARSAIRQRVWRSNDALFAQAPLDAPLSYRAHDVYAGLLFDHGDNAGGEREARFAIALYPHDPVLYRDLAHEYMRGGLCVPAIPLLRRSVAENGTMQTDARLLLAECLLAQGDAAEARVELLRGISEGYYPYYGPGYHRVLLSVDSALAHRGAPPARPVAADAESGSHPRGAS
jgi:hypothetical protein